MSFDPDYVLQVTERNIGRPPRIFTLLNWRYRTAGLRDWANIPDPISRIYQAHRQILKNGQVRWAALIQANTNSFAPGKSACPAQVLYSPTLNVKLDHLIDVARSCFALKGTTPEHPEELRLAKMITDEMERALDWPIPSTLSKGYGLVTTIIVPPRKFMPGGILQFPYIPILADPATRLAMIVPCQYWEPGFRQEWQKAAKATIKEWKKKFPAEEIDSSAIPIVLTEAAGMQLRKIMNEQSLDLRRSWLRVGVSIGQNYICMYELKFESKIHKRRDVTCTSQGVQIVVDCESLPLLVGTTIDYEIRPTGAGFLFINPNAVQKEQP
jgi:iron-sulfur cluster assembly protein